jgi:hypothetical protein
MTITELAAMVNNANAVAFNEPDFKRQQAAKEGVVRLAPTMVIIIQMAKAMYDAPYATGKYDDARNAFYESLVALEKAS